MSDNLMDSILGGIPKPAEPAPAKPGADPKPDPQQGGGKKHLEYSDDWKKEFGEPKA